MVGLDVDRVAYFDPAVERGLGNYKEDQIEIRGNSIKEVFKQMWLPYMGGFDQWPEYNIHAEGACSSCQALLAYTMEKLKSLGEYDKHAGMSIVVGKTKELPKDVDINNMLLMGDCVKKFRKQGGVFCEGCPPGEPMPLWAITDNKTFDENTEPDPHLRERMDKETPIFLEYMKKRRAEADEK
jgi:hypothetical protein